MLLAPSGNEVVRRKEFGFVPSESNAVATPELEEATSTTYAVGFLTQTDSDFED